MASAKAAAIAATAVLLAVGNPQSIAAPTASDGATLFRQRCQACHTNVAGEPAKVGPNLAGVVGRKAAATKFAYSPALKASGLVWSKANLGRFLAAPTKAVPGTRMMIVVPVAADRDAIVAYLAKKR